MFLFETGLPTRYYVPTADVRMALFEPSMTRTACPYKGTASYYTGRVDGSVYEDIAWFYPDPIAEVARIKGMISFFNERVDAIRVDGAETAKPVTKWS